VGGSVVMEGNSLFARLQKWDWLYLCVVGSGFAGLKIPQSLFGKNMIVTRRLYNQIGGFTPKKVWTEDLDLVQKSAGKARVTLNLSPATAVYSLPADTLKEFFRQRLRWLKGGIRVNLPGFAVMFIALLMDFAFIVSIFCNFQLWLVVFLFKLFSDIIILYRAMNKYKLNNDMIYLPIFSIFSILYQLILISIYPFNMNLKWK
jgi:cellulose synthase/poly-beta-1,6-N-acetylglucosamine synthase-like glycosyltransferase